MKKMNWKKLVLLALFVLVSGTLFCCGQKNPAEEYFLQEEPEMGVTEGLDAGQETEGIKVQEDGSLEDGDGEVLEVTAYIHGCVKKPGVYSLPSGSRLYELVEKAGGFSKKARKDAWNQAVLVEDGQQYKIPSKKAYRRSRKEAEMAEAVSTGMTAQEASGENRVSVEPGKLDINSASREELLTLSCIGESKADAIVSYREEHGRFQSVEELMNISGIKEGVFRQIQDKITVAEK